MNIQLIRAPLLIIPGLVLGEKNTHAKSVLLPKSFGFIQNCLF